MTTLPGRIQDTIEPIKHILKQSRPLDVLYLHLPMITRKGLSYTIPDDYEDNFIGYRTNFVINRCETDYGPLTKLMPTLELETGADTHIITFDDDIIYHKHLVRAMANKARNRPDICYATSGVKIGGFPFCFEVVQENVDDQEVDMIMGVHGVMYKRSMFTTCSDLLTFGDGMSSIKECLVTNDDHRISGYLSSRDIPRVVMGYSTRKLAYVYRALQSDALCGRGPSMIVEHIKIISVFIREGLYRYHVSNPFSSMTATMYGIVGILMVSVCLARKASISSASFFAVTLSTLFIAYAREKFEIEFYTPVACLSPFWSFDKYPHPTDSYDIGFKDDLGIKKNEALDCSMYSFKTSKVGRSFREESA